MGLGRRQEGDVVAAVVHSGDEGGNDIPQPDGCDVGPHDHGP